MGIIAVIGLYLTSLKEEGFDFTRNLKGQLLPVKVITLDNRFFYLAGEWFPYIYLGNNYVPDTLWRIELNLRGSLQKFTFDKNNKIQGATYVQVHSSQLFISDLTHYKLFRGSLKDATLVQVERKQQLFADAIPVSNTSVVTRELDGYSKEYIIAKRIAGNSVTIRNDTILEKQIDGIFCTDGMLRYSESANVLVYIYYYRNQFIVIDTALHVQYRRHTIDPIFKARIKVAELTKDRTVTLASPPYLVNAACALYKHNILINSNIRSKDQSSKSFEEGSTIDIYDIRSGAYQASFEIPKFRNSKLREFKIYNGYLFALHDNYLVLYDASKLFP
jgi:hypothetical protein